jgi:hypothetical protein
MGEIIKACEIIVGKPERKTPLGNLGIDGRMLLKWRVLPGLIRAAFFEHSNEHSGSVKGRKFLE